MNRFIKAYGPVVCQINRMKMVACLCLLILAGACRAAETQLQLVASTEPENFFFGNQRRVSVELGNLTARDFKGEIRARIFEAGSTTAVLLSDTTWKKIEVPPNETVLEGADLDFPAVNAKTGFLVQWLENTNRVIGTTRVLIYPTNLLRMLPALGRNDFGVFDPGNQLKPLLKEAGVSFMDLGEIALTNFAGKLAIIGPFESRSKEPDGMAEQIRTIAQRNVAVVWLQPPPAAGACLQPSFYLVQKSWTAVVVAQPDLVSDLAEVPKSQLNLIYFCNLALHPQPAVLPDLTLQPEN